MKHLGTVTLETQRLILRKFAMTDAEDAFNNWTNDPRVCRFWQWTPHVDAEETKTCVSLWVSEYASADYYHWVIELKESHMVIGYIYLDDIDETKASVSVHFALSVNQWGKGITTEACGRVIDFAVREIGVRKVWSYHHANNPASGRVLIKCGMKLVSSEYRHIPECDRISGEYLLYEKTV